MGFSHSMPARQNGPACARPSSTEALSPSAAGAGRTGKACAITWSSATQTRKASSCMSAAGWWNAASAGSRTGVGCSVIAPDASMSRPPARLRGHPVRRRSLSRPHASSRRCKLNPLKQVLRCSPDNVGHRCYAYRMCSAEMQWRMSRQIFLKTRRDNIMLGRGRKCREW